VTGGVVLPADGDVNSPSDPSVASEPSTEIVYHHETTQVTRSSTVFFKKQQQPQQSIMLKQVSQRFLYQVQGRANSTFKLIRTPQILSSSIALEASYEQRRTHSE
jgi:hypothetical protein